MNRSLARVFSLAAAASMLAVTLAPRPLAAQSSAATNFWFAGTRLIFDRPIPLEDDVAVGVDDPGLQRFLARVGATLSYQPQSRYVIVTAADRRIITFTIGDARYSVGGVTARTSFVPFVDGGRAIVPFLAIARALYVEPVETGGETILEPQVGGLDVRPDGRRTIVTLRGATALTYTKLAETPGRVQLTFSGVGSTLAPNRHIGGSGVADVSVQTQGVARNPSTTVTITGVAGAQHVISAAASPYEFTVVFAPAGVALDALATPAPYAVAPPPAPAETPPPVAAPTPQSGPATITDVDIQPVDGGLTVRLALSGSATFDWRRLGDDRWYVDLADTRLAGAGRDERPANAAVASLRIRQIGTPAAPVVRVAFTLRGDRRVEIAPAENSLTLAVGLPAETNLAHTGNGQIGGATVAQSNDQSPAGPPVAPIAAPNDLDPNGTPWKFAPAPSAGGGSRLIVIDPGHGGGDAGTSHDGMMEKNLTFDISRRLRTLLAQQGWNVRLTREADIDPYTPALFEQYKTDGLPNASDRAYLQTRCDVANNSNARLFISIHINYSPSPAVSGTTFYYTKPQDVALAQALERSVIPAAGTRDDGVVHGNLYVTKHTTMPAVLIESAFISNPGDAALLHDPRFLQNLAAGIAAGVKAYAGAVPAQTSQADR